MTWQEQWERRNPADVLERKQQGGKPKPDAALARIERLFAGEDMAREADFRTLIDPDLHKRLENWGWIMRGSYGSPGMSPTAEVCHRLAVHAGAYKYDKTTEPPSRELTADAHEIERAWRSSLMPGKDRMILAGYYVYRFHPNRVSRAAAIRFSEFDSRMARACGILVNILQKLASRTERAHNPLHNLTADTHSVAE